MMIKFKKKNHDLLGAIAEDAFGTVASAVPINTIRTLIRMMRPQWTKENRYLRWDDLSGHLEHYGRLRDECISFRHRNKRYYIPQVRIIAAKASSIPPASVGLTVIPEEFEIDSEIQAATESSFREYERYLTLVGRINRHGQVLRLKSFSSDEKGWDLVVQPVDYKAYLRTNLLLDSIVGPSDRTLRDLVHPDGDLAGPSRLADPIGINMLLFTSDGKAILPRRSRRVVVRPLQFSPSFSGTLDWWDVAGRAVTNLDQIPLLREGNEELHIMHTHLQADSIRFHGITRELIRGGQPEAFFSALTNLSWQEVIRLYRKAPHNWEFGRPTSWIAWHVGRNAVTGSADPYEIRRAFDDLLNGHRHLSVPLLTALVLWIESTLGEQWYGSA